MKTLKDFTPEIQSKIPEYHKISLDGVFDGGKYKVMMPMKKFGLTTFLI